ncbi:MAG: hypothetical protein ACXWUG_12080 [Polyangiales bacterium]
MRTTGLKAALAATALLLGCAASGTMSVGGASTADVVESSAGPGELGDMRFRAKVCEGIDLKPEFGTLDEKNLLDFLHAHGLETQVERARNDLIYVDITNAGTKEPVRLRVAILKSGLEAGAELHNAILQHGSRSWGVHRGNLAVLAPVAASEADAVVFAAKTKLACWGVFTIAGRDDTFVIPGAYFEL